MGKKKQKATVKTAYDLREDWLNSLAERIQWTTSFGGDSYYADSVAEDIKGYINEIREFTTLSVFEKKLEQIEDLPKEKEPVFRGRRVDNGEWVYVFGIDGDMILYRNKDHDIVPVPCIFGTIHEALGIDIKDKQKTKLKGVL